MSTDFSLDALLNGSTSSTSVTSPNNNKKSATSPNQLNTQKALPIALAAPVSDAKRSKRKRENSDDEKENKKGGAEPVKKKRVRTAFTREQLTRLEFAFTQNQYPDMLMRENIAEELGLPNQKVHVSQIRVYSKFVAMLLYHSYIWHTIMLSIYFFIRFGFRTGELSKEGSGVSQALYFHLQWCFHFSTSLLKLHPHR